MAETHRSFDECDTDDRACDEQSRGKDSRDECFSACRSNAYRSNAGRSLERRGRDERAPEARPGCRSPRSSERSAADRACRCLETCRGKTGANPNGTTCSILSAEDSLTSGRRAAQRGGASGVS